ncbi:MAG: hypothetical protein CEO21_91 [Microgenomates group bacterium Gr01-1014_80]|nr:MAG: hypothetical protein CEO21_91 [Microgenomates group bacterium Gr01-1014_80]
MNGQLWTNSLNLATIATWVMLIGAALVLYLTRTSRRSTRKQSR